jgi:hypothetical protein
LENDEIPPQKEIIRLTSLLFGLFDANCLLLVSDYFFCFFEDVKNIHPLSSRGYFMAPSVIKLRLFASMQWQELN